MFYSGPLSFVLLIFVINYEMLDTCNSAIKCRYFSIITFQGIKMLCISAQHGDETLPCSLSQPTKCFLFITFQRCKALQPDLGLYFDFLEDSYKLRCIMYICRLGV